MNQKSAPRGSLLFLLCAVLLAGSARIATAQQSDQSVPVESNAPLKGSTSAADSSVGTAAAELSLGDILNVTTTVAAKKKLTPRESPGIVSVVTEEDIRNSGARDLHDILSLLVPGFSFGIDVEGETGPAIRGLWAIEGKVLLLIDGIEANEEIFNTVLLQNHYPASIIERVEVIRGPGSAIYGSFASLGVISVVTKGASMNGVYVNALNSQMGRGPSHRNLTIGFGKKFSDDLAVSLLAVKGHGNRSDRDMPDYTGATVPMINNWRADPALIDANVRFKGLDFRGVVDLYNTTHTNLYTATGQHSLKHDERQHSYMFDLRYNLEALPNLIVQPRLNYKLHRPFSVDAYNDPLGGPFALHKEAKKALVGVATIWDPITEVNVVSGVEASQNRISIPDQYQVNPDFAESFNTLPANSTLINNNYSVYTQSIWSNPIANLTLGGRYETTKNFGDAFVPRLGLTKVINDFHAKLMVTRSFRTPSGIQADRLPPGVTSLTAEKATNIETELGYKLTDQMFIQANVFNTKITDAIVYQAATTGTYQNAGNLGTRGFETEFRYQARKTSLYANYAFYAPMYSTVNNFEVPGVSGQYLGFPKHRFNVLGGYKFNETFSLHPSLQYFGPKYAYTGFDAGGAYVLGSYNPAWIGNLNFRIKDLFIAGLEVDLMTHNLFNSKDVMPAPYLGSNLASVPVASRTWDVNVSYNYHL